MYSVDSAFKRLDNQDKSIIAHVLEKDWTSFKRVLILGSGRGRIGVVLALLGFEVLCVDIEDYSDFYKTISHTLDIEESLRFEQSDLSSQDIYSLCSKRNIIIAQRVFQYLPYLKTKEIIQRCHKNLLDNGEMYINISSLQSTYGHHYPCEGNDISERFCIPESLDPGLEVNAPMALYSEQEVLSLFDNDFWDLISLENNAFGNIKAHFIKK